MTDALASECEVILFDNAGVGRSSGNVPPTIAAMATHVFAFIDGLGLATCDVLGFSLGGMIVFARTESSQAAGEAFISRLVQSTQDRAAAPASVQPQSSSCVVEHTSGPSCRQLVFLGVGPEIRKILFVASLPFGCWVVTA